MRNKERAGPGMGVLGEAGMREEENTGEKDEDGREEWGMAPMTAFSSLHGPMHSKEVWGPRVPRHCWRVPGGGCQERLGRRKPKPRSAASGSPESEAMEATEDGFWVFRAWR